MTDYANSLDRFVDAQGPVFDTALAELRRGKKRTHWMWFVFPQLAGLGYSAAAKLYGLADRAEAQAYIEHALLGSRYQTCVEALQDLPIYDPVAVFGTTDAMKLRSSLTVFEAAKPAPLLSAALDRWFSGERDQATLALIRQQDDPSEGCPMPSPATDAGT